MGGNESSDLVFDLQFYIRKVFFKGFESTFDFPPGIRHGYIKALMFLKMEGPSLMSKISEKANLEKGSFTTVSNRLIDLGYVKKIQDPSDKRAFFLDLTEEGHELTARIARAHHAYISAKIGVLSEEEQGMLLSALKMATVLIKKCEQ